MSAHLTPNSQGTQTTLLNHINAPKKRVCLTERWERLNNIPRLIFPEDEERKPEWKVLVESDLVRDKFLRWTPEDIIEIDDLDTLENLRALYSPFSQPINPFETAYLEIIIGAINKRLYHC